MLNNGKCNIISCVKVEEIDIPETTYNLEVQDYHTYYVGNEGILVHNACATDAIDNVTKQNHHYLSNKHSKFTQKFENITSKYGLDLNGSWNIEKLPHVGRHAKQYHNYMLESITKIDAVAQGNTSLFLQQFEVTKATIRANPGMMYKSFWLGG